MEQTPHALLAAVAADQHGCFNTQQFIATGRTRAQLYHDVRTGRYERLLDTVYRFPGQHLRTEALLMAGVLMHPGHVFAARGSVLRLAGLRARAERPHLVIPHDLGYAFDRRWQVHVSRTLERDLPQRFGAILANSTARALIEDGMACPSPVWFDIVSEAVRRGLVTIEELHQALAAAGRIPNRRTLREALERLDPRLVMARSVPEISLVNAVERSTGHRPVLNHRILDRTGALVDEVDAAIPEVLLAVEGDSRGFHIDPSTMERDLLKDLRRRRHHWITVRVPIRMVHHQPHALDRAISDAFAQAEARLPTVPAWAREAARRGVEA